jgi:hypothetical protein
MTVHVVQVVDGGGVHVGVHVDSGLGSELSLKDRTPTRLSRGRAGRKSDQASLPSAWGSGGRGETGQAAGERDSLPSDIRRYRTTFLGLILQ